MTRPRNHAMARQGGYTLAAVLWLLGLLAVAVTSMTFFTVNSLSVIATARERTKIDGVLRAGVEAAVLEIMAVDPTTPVIGTAEFRVGAGVARTAWRGEMSLIDVNLAPQEVMYSLFRIAGATDPEALSLTEAVMERRAPRGRAATIAFGHISQLGELEAPAAVLRRLRAYVTVYSGQPRIDPRIAPREVLTALPDMTNARVTSLVELRERGPSDPSRWTTEAGDAAKYFSFDRPPGVRIRVDASLENGTRAAAEVVVALYQEDKEPYRVLDWDDSPPERRLDAINGERP